MRYLIILLFTLGWLTGCANQGEVESVNPNVYAPTPNDAKSGATIAETSIRTLDAHR